MRLGQPALLGGYSDNPVSRSMTRHLDLNAPLVTPFYVNLI